MTPEQFERKVASVGIPIVRRSTDENCISWWIDGLGWRWMGSPQSIPDSMIKDVINYCTRGRISDE